ncbi:MAG: sugar phosphate isomerase/epimerase family protein [Burkholderiaceae bacterium]
MRDLGQRLDLCSINTVTLGHRRPLAETLDAIARAGFGYAAPWRDEVQAAGTAAVARQLRALGLKLSGYLRSSFYAGARPAEYEAAIEDNRRALEQAAEIGAPSLIVVGGGLAPGTRDLAAARARYADGAARLWEYARELGIGLTLEPLHPMYAAERSCVCTLADALDLCADIDPQRRGGLGIAVDVYHCWWDPALAAQIRRAGAEGRLDAFHVSDWLSPTRDMLLDRGMMGDGIIDLPAIRAMVEEAGYRGPVEVEIFSRDDWWRRDPAQTLQVCAQRLQTVC